MLHSTLNTKSVSVAFHLIREVVARDERRRSCTHANKNEAGLLMENLSEKRGRYSLAGFFIVPASLSRDIYFLSLIFVVH